MADITASCTIKGGDQHWDRPYAWHVWDVLIPSGTLTAAQTDDIVMPDRLSHGVGILGVRSCLVQADASSTGSILGTFETAIEVISTGVVTPSDDLIATINLESAGLGTLGSAFGALDAVGAVFHSNSATGVIDGEEFGRFNLEVTPAATLTDGDIRVLLGVLGGRIDY